MGQIIRCITTDGTVAATAIDSCDIVAAAEHYFSTSAVVTAALGRLLTAASLMGDQLKSEGNTLTLRVNGDGPVGSLVAVSDYMGNVRGYAQNNIVELPLNQKGKLDVGGAVGHGELFVTKDLNMKEPYNGAVELVSGEIAEDIAAYYAESEQIPTVCALGVLVNPDLTVKAAGGFLIQLLPFAPDSTIDILEKNISALPSVTTMLSSGLNPKQMLERALEGFELEVLDTSSAEYRCNCSEERVKKVLRSLGSDELEKLAGEQENTQVCCHFCDKVYNFSSEQVRQIADSLKK